MVTREQLHPRITELDPVERALFVAELFVAELFVAELFVAELWRRTLLCRTPPWAWPTTWRASEHPSIVSTPGVCGGAARLIRTRIPVWSIERMRQLGCSDSDILRSFPCLRAVDLVEACSYAASHADEMERAIRENEEA